ncbi:MAG: hypothetical protein BM556_09640 [Bacteriovorax sp. MedPE-SWde]|nr:MAG: hypothetical protein BM556_09640 [Bacteriovorax sp. MedPE-SWde]
MIKLINKLYLFIFLWAGFGVYEAYEFSTTERERIESSIQSLEVKIRKGRKEKKKIGKYLKNITQKKKEIEQVALQIEKIQKKLPSKVADSENIKFVRDISNSLKIRKVNIVPGKDVDNGFYITKSYNFEGVGTYLQFLLLVEKIAESERILNVRNINLKRIPSKKRGRYELVTLKAGIESYRYNAAHKEDRGIQNIEKDFLESQKKKKPKKRRRRKKR